MVRKSSNLNICLDEQKSGANDKQDMIARAPITLEIYNDSKLNVDSKFFALFGNVLTFII